MNVLCNVAVQSVSKKLTDVQVFIASITKRRAKYRPDDGGSKNL
jgi:hypothetical protein